MKKFTLMLIGLLLLSAISVFGQSQSDSIQTKKSLGTVFIQHGRRLTPGQLLEITKINTDAYNEMKIAKSNYAIGTVFGFAGGFLVGWTVGTAVGGGEPNWALAGIGAGLIVVSIPFSTSYTKHAKKAVEIYNNALSQTGSRKIDFSLALTYNGIGINITF